MADTATPTHCKACSERLGAQITRIAINYTTRREDGSTKKVNGALYLCGDCTAALVRTAQQGGGAAAAASSGDDALNFPVGKKVGAHATDSQAGKKVGAHATVDVPASANATADMWLARIFGKRAQNMDPETKAMVEGVFHENTKPESFEKLMRREVRFVVATAIALDDKKDDAGKQARTMLVDQLPNDAAELLSKRFSQSKPKQTVDNFRSALSVFGLAWVAHVDAVFEKSKQVKAPTDADLRTTLPSVGSLLGVLDTLGPFKQADKELLLRTLNAHLESTHAVVKLLADPAQTSRDYMFPPLMRKAVEDGMAAGEQIDRATGGRS